MRNRTRSDDQTEQQRSEQREPREPAREARNEPTRARERERDDDKEQSRRVRVPKIQYRFLKELEEKGVTVDARKGALAMADKIRKFPLDERAVMGSWERFTKKAIEEFKTAGPSPERDRQHGAYAVLFSAMRDKEPAASGAELKKRVEVLEVSPAPRKEAERERPVPNRAQQQQEQRPQQRELIERERPLIDKQIDTTLARLRELSSPLRSTIEASARELVLEGHHTWRSAREVLPDAVKELRAEASEKNTVHTLTLAVIARSPSQGELRAEIDALRYADHKELKDEARARLERYPPLETGIADVRRDAVAASVRNAIDPSAGTRREALVLQEALDQIETLADPKRLQWDGVGEELAERLA